jgi:serine/threonine protein kinase
MTNERIELLKRVNDLCDEFESLLAAGKEPEIEEWIRLVSPSDRNDFFYELLKLELAFYPVDSGGFDRLGEYLGRFSDYSTQVVRAFADYRAAENETSCQPPGDSPIVGFQSVTVGDTVGRYRLSSVLGSGGFSTVFAAFDVESKQTVAIKSLRRKPDANYSKIVESFIVEAAALSDLEHESIPKVYEIGEDQNGDPYVVMEFFKGHSLQSVLEKQLFPLETVLKFLAKTAEVLGYVHECGFCHRDLKPSNIIVGFDGNPRIVDFGLAIHESTQNKRSRERAGTTSFMSPEQMLGDCGGLDGRTDIWSLGVMLYFVVAQRLPFRVDSSTQEPVEDIFDRPVKPPRQIKGNCATTKLEQICLKALRKFPENRYSTAYDFAIELHDAADELNEELLLEDAEKLTRSDATLIRLARQAGIWKEEPVLQHLPGFYRYFQFRFGTRKDLWSKTESRMMRAAGKRMACFTVIGAMVVAVFSLLVSQLIHVNHQIKIKSLINQIGVAEIRDNAVMVENLKRLADEDTVNELLRNSLAEAEAMGDLEKQIRFGLPLIGSSPEMRSLVFEKLLDARIDEINPLSKALGMGSAVDLEAHQQIRLREIIAAKPAAEGAHMLWPEPDGFVSAEVFRAGGCFAYKWAYCCRMPLEKFQSVSERLRESKFRPICVRPFLENQKTYVAAVWNRDTVGWEIQYDLAQKDIETEVEKRRANGHYLTDLSEMAINSDTQQPECLAIWSIDNGKHAQARRQLGYANLGGAEFDSDRRKFILLQDDFQPDCFSNFRGLADIRFNTFHGFPCDSLLEQQTDLARLELERDATSSFARSVLDRGRLFLDQQSTWLNDAELGHPLTQSSLQYFQTIKNRLGELNACESSLDSLSQVEPLFFQTFFDAVLKLARSEIRQIRQFDISIAIDKLHSELRSDFSALEEFYLAESCLRIAVREPVSSMCRIELEDIALSLFESALDRDPALDRWLLRSESLRTASQNSELIGLSDHLGKESFSGTWLADNSDFVADFFPPQSVKSHMRAAAAKRSNGWRPVSITTKTINGKQLVSSVWHLPVWAPEDDLRVQRVVNAICYGWKHDFNLGVEKLLVKEAGATIKNRLIHALAEFDIPAKKMISMVRSSEHTRIHHSLLLILGNMKTKSFSLPELDQMRSIANDFVHHEDAGIRAAAQWMAKRQGIEIEHDNSQFSSTQPRMSRNWYINSIGKLLIRIRGLDSDPVFISSKPVSLANYKLYASVETDGQVGEAQSAVVTFDEAAEYCNWLSAREGFDPEQWCYVRDFDGTYRAKEDHERLPGYRLPSQHELEQAAQVTTSDLWLDWDASLAFVPDHIADRLESQPNIYGFIGLARGYKELTTVNSPLPSLNRYDFVTETSGSFPDAEAAAAEAPFRVTRTQATQNRPTYASKRRQSARQ